MVSKLEILRVELITRHAKHVDVDEDHFRRLIADGVPSAQAIKELDEVADRRELARMAAIDDAVAAIEGSSALESHHRHRANRLVPADEALALLKTFAETGRASRHGCEFIAPVRGDN